MPNKSTIQLCPAQCSVLEALLKGLQIGWIFRVWGGVGRRKTTVLKEAHQQLGGAFLGMKEFVDASSRSIRWRWKSRSTIWSSTATEDITGADLKPSRG